MNIAEQANILLVSEKLGLDMKINKQVYIEVIKEQLKQRRLLCKIV